MDPSGTPCGPRQEERWVARSRVWTHCQLPQESVKQGKSCGTAARTLPCETIAPCRVVRHGHGSHAMGESMLRTAIDKN